MKNKKWDNFQCDTKINGIVFPYQQLILRNCTNSFLKINFKRLAISALKNLYSIHDAGVYHCDIKPGNMCITKKLEVLYFDFGHSTTLKRDKLPSYNKTTIYFSKCNIFLMFNFIIVIAF